MALTPTQVNVHLRLILTQHFTSNDEGFHRFLETCRDYAVAGGLDEKEAARTIARFAFEKVIGRVPTVDDIHILQGHKIVNGDAL